MKITCNRQELVDAVSNVQRAVSTKSTMAALEGILLKTNKEKLELCGYNLELGITTTMGASIQEEGEIVLSAKLFSDIVRRLPEDTVFLSVDSKLITEIKSGASEFSIVGLSASEYPELPVVTGASDFSLPSEVLKSMIRQTLFAVSETDAKPIHTGTLFELEENQIKLVSVDGYRLAMRKEPIKCEQTIDFVVPGKTLGEVLKLLPDSEKEISLSVGRRHIIFEIENYRVISRLLDGEFLDYKGAIPVNSTTTATIGTREFIESIERVSLLITDRLKSPVRCIFSEHEIKLSCSTSIGKANDELKIPIGGDEVEIGFNNRYLLDAIRNSDSDKVLIELNGPLSPMKVLPVEGDSFLFLVLPVRLKTE